MRLIEPCTELLTRCGLTNKTFKVSDRLRRTDGSNNRRAALAAREPRGGLCNRLHTGGQNSLNLGTRVTVNGRGQ